MNDIAPIIAESSHSAPHQLLTGTWHNQLGSELVIEADGARGLTGRYTSAAGVVAGTSYPLIGTYDPDQQSITTVLGFVVDWTEVHAVTVWSGQYHHRDGTIAATWLMATETDEGDEWKSTFVGHDLFHQDVTADSEKREVSSSLG